MERVRKEKPLWVKKTPGTLILRKPSYFRIKPKQQVRATPEELGNQIDQFELLEGDVDMKQFPQVGDEKIPQEPDIYSVDHVGAGWYNVLSPTGKVMNETKLRSEQAEVLKNELEAQEDDQTKE